MRVDVAIIGGGPAGLALGIGCAKRGLSTCVLEQRAFPVDKACGEGVMPYGLRRLEALGVRLPPDAWAPFRSIRFVDEDGRTLKAQVPGEGGRGIRRTTLSSALAQRAADVGVAIHERIRLRKYTRVGDGFVLGTNTGELRAGFLVGADGLKSWLRKSERLELPAAARKRFGLRQHFRVVPWSSEVEVHLSSFGEAYVTPAGPNRVGVAFLWEEGFAPRPLTVDAFLTRFPALEAKLASAARDSSPRGAGPMEQRVHGVTRERFALLGDAAGYVDAITGEGLSLAFNCAHALSELLPDALAKNDCENALLQYEDVFARQFRHCARRARAMLSLTRRTLVRRAAIHGLSKSPRATRLLFQRALSHPHTSLEL